MAAITHVGRCMLTSVRLPAAGGEAQLTARCLPTLHWTQCIQVYTHAMQCSPPGRNVPAEALPKHPSPHPPCRFMAMSWAFHTPNLVWQVLTVLSLVYTSIFLFPYLLKLVLYPRKAC